jgi:glutamine kinase
VKLLLNKPTTQFGTKAETLERLRPLVKKSTIGKQVAFTVGDWRRLSATICRHIAYTFPDTLIAVRSSATGEDTQQQSSAGKYATVLNVPSKGEDVLVKAVELVINSYTSSNEREQVLVQEMVPDVVEHGVVFTRTLNDGPYYVVNSSSGQRTDLVTAGADGSSTTFVLKGSVNTPVLLAVAELEQLLGNDSLDVEFAVDKHDNIHILQVRPLLVQPRYDHQAEFTPIVQHAQEQFEAYQRPSPFVLGNRTLFSVMSDWNPAEIIGTRPNRLALSLYQYLITDDVWARQRAEFGYRDIRPHPLIVSFLGRPYVDLRACFNSFIPAKLDSKFAARLVDYYIEYLQTHPHLHDKVEFDVAYTSYVTDFKQQSQRLVDAGFKVNDVSLLEDALIQLTRQAYIRAWTENDIKSLTQLDNRREHIIASHMDTLAKARALLDDCKAYGTPAFAHLARNAFVATALLRSLQRTGALSEQQVNELYGGLQTITKEIEQAQHDKQALLEKYGHLRPGTYDIRVPTYRDKPSLYFKFTKEQHAAPPAYPWPKETQDAVDNALSPLQWKPYQFYNFTRTAIQYREYAKFVFTKNLSEALELFAQFGEERGLSREDIKHLHLYDIIYLSSNSVADEREYLRSRITNNSQEKSLADLVEMPPVITSAQDFMQFTLPPSQPNFTTQKQITAECTGPEGDLTGRIVLVPQADPGYDWLFGHQIAGLITMYGGSNSHMTIRCAEFGLPAAIGVGEVLYERLKQAKVVHLDCESKRIEVVR